MNHKAVVNAVSPDSEAHMAGIEPGDIIKSINGNKIEDELDFRFYAQDSIVRLDVLKKDGSEEIIEIEDPESPDLGISFESALFGGAKHCSNKCIFCFIDQLPQGLRDTLYFKDDDSRLSFLTGNYITLTNVRDRDIEKIVKMRLEPINISVHTTNPDLRVFMLKNKNAGNSLRYMDKLKEGKIHMNCQIVLVNGVNDGAELDRTIEDLSKYHPYITSVSVVPVGITNFRDKLYKLEPFLKKDAEKVIHQVQKWQLKLLHEIETRFIYIADEFFLKAGIPIPSGDSYEGYFQIENGVGLLRSMKDEFYDAMDEDDECAESEVSLITGVAAFDTISEFAKEAMKRHPSLRIKVHKVINHFFGEKITVAGLLTGRDIKEQVKDACGRTLIPEEMLRSGTDVFLDDMTVSELEKALNTKITVTKSNGYSLWDNIVRRSE